MRFLRLRPVALRLVIGALFVAAGVLVAADFAEARAGRSGSFGSRGTRSWSTPAPTPTAPTAQPLQRSAAPQTQTAQGARAPGVQSGGFMRGGFMGGLMGGLLGAGIFGLLMGSGFFSGLGSLSGIIGLLLQVGLIFIVVRLVMGWMRSRNQPSYAGGARPDPMNRNAMNRDALNGAGSAPQGSASTGTAAPRTGFGTAPRGKPIKLEGSDFDIFERTLTEVQSAYGRADKPALAALLTPEMSGYMAEELDEMARDGLENRITDVKLLQGDLSEAWSEGDTEYATVAMRYELKDVTLDKATGRVVQGDPDRVEQAVEFWTFARPARGDWKLSAIQQG
ncbi:putative lipid-binding transport protein (Tim44 family) [Ancylobacter aquaticus]|uniref:Putative lipid-binding transport protein (Tim44 family) n=1 Tax=Ancylobacter aquaticus TaxID=100 RepID=A0A4R1I4F8_ANCAQ|nr:TIM44-like domain-containing protein [Ancylobacter aquaticus]TCK28893.1 putative lipid-binding transport protein (Tim44 family) [Ancylobacter aquaticus]